MLTADERNEAAVRGLELAEEKYSAVECRDVIVLARLDPHPKSTFRDGKRIHTDGIRHPEIRVSDDWMTVDGADYAARFLAAWVLRMRERES